MDSALPQDARQQTPQSPEQSQSRLSSVVSMILYAPVHASLALLSKGLVIFRPVAPHIIPLLVCILFVPLVIFFAISAGWVVWRSVAVGWESPLYLQYGDGVSPYAEVSLPKLVARQRYDISLHLVVPATDSNFALGNFMTTLTLSTPANKTLTSIRRPAVVLRPQHGPFSLLASRPNVINLEVPLLTSFAAGTSRVIANVELGRQDSWKSLGDGQSREITIVSASVRGMIKHHGIRGLATRFPLTFALISTISFLAISLLIVGACILPTMLHRQSKGTVDGTERAPLPPQEGGALYSSSDGDEKPSRRRRRSRASASRSSSRRTTVKTEASTTPMPSADSNLAPIRRRRSRHSQRSSDSDS